MPAPVDEDTSEIAELVHAIRETYGHDFGQYDAASVRRRLGAALAKSGCSSLAELRHELVRCPAVFAGVLDDLTVQVSEMFRDPPVFRALRREVLPVLRTYPLIKIWHAGCSSGEEVYAMAIVLLEEGLYERARIYATDTNPRALQRAREGIYGEADTERFAEAYRASGGRAELSDYVHRAYGRVAIREQVRQNVFFFQHDLVSDHGLGEMQLILCRNVLIYLKPAARERAFGVLNGSLARRGFLCLGAAEALPTAAAGAFEEANASARIYRMRAA